MSCGADCKVRFRIIRSIKDRQDTSSTLQVKKKITACRLNDKEALGALTPVPASRMGLWPRVGDRDAAFRAKAGNFPGAPGRQRLQPPAVDVRIDPVGWFILGAGVLVPGLPSVHGVPFQWLRRCPRGRLLTWGIRVCRFGRSSRGGEGSKGRSWVFPGSWNHILMPSGQSCPIHS